MNLDTVGVLVGSLFDPCDPAKHGGDFRVPIPGSCLTDLLLLWSSGGRYDEVDALYVDHETIGGG